MGDQRAQPTEFAVEPLLRGSIITASDVRCAGVCRHKSAEECASATHMVFPYRGTYVRHVGSELVVADAGQVLFFNAGEGYRVSHPIQGGDASVTMVVDRALMSEIAPRPLLRDGDTPAFHAQRMNIDMRAQSLVALLRHRVSHGLADSLEAESLALSLVQCALAPRSPGPRSLRPCSLGRRAARGGRGSAGRQRLVSRAKLILASDCSRRWTLKEIAAEVGCSPVYLTQIFRLVEGIPLYRYQLRLRLARALDLLARHADLSALSLDLGFSSHSHFSAAFRQAYGRSPSAFRRAAVLARSRSQHR